MKNILLLLLCVCIINAGCSQKTVLQTSSETPKLLTVLTFENAGELSKWKKETTKDESFKISDSVARKGKHSARFQLDIDDPLLYTGKRSEIHLDNEAEAERWFGFSTYFPSDYTADPGGECVAQWHETPDFNLGETWRSPPLGLDIFNGQFKAVVMWATDPVNTNKTISGRKDFELGELVKNEWIDWVFHIKWSWQSDGVLEIWKNKKKVLTYNGPTSYNDQKFPYFKLGLYKWSWNTEEGRLKSTVKKRVAYLDEIRIGNKFCNSQTVSPQ